MVRLCYENRPDPDFSNVKLLTDSFERTLSPPSPRFLWFNLLKDLSFS